MRVAIVGSADNWHLRDLRRAAGDRFELVPVTFRSLAADVRPEALFAACEGTPLREVDAVLVRSMPPASLEQVVFRMDLLGELERNGQTVVNAPRALETAVDKFLTTAKLRRAGLTVPRTVAAQTPLDAMAAFADLGGDVVVKPLFGGEGRGIARICDEAIAERTFRLLTQLGCLIYLQPFIPHEGYDLRVLLIGGEAWGVRRRNSRDWRTNVSRGAVAEPIALDDSLVETARRAAAAVGAVVAGVDLLPGKDGRLYAIEVNAVPGWRALAQACQVDIARRMLDFLADQVRGAC